MARGEQGSASLIPKPIPALDIRTLPIGPMEAFVLSRVDGRATEADIAIATGLSPSDVTEHLQRLAALGAVSYGAEGPRSGTTRTVQAILEGSTSGTHAVAAPIIREAPAPVAYDPAELDEPADIPADRKRVILDTFYRLERLNHYELLKVPTNADKKAVKTAYFEVVSTYHPDKYYGKQLGAFKPKLERIFQRVTEAHDTLTRVKAREEYDSFLESQAATRALDALADPSAALPEVDEIFKEMEREALLAAERSRSSTPPSGTSSPAPQAGGSSLAAASSPVQARPSPVPEAQARSVNPPLDARPSMTADERRRALARKLAGATVPPPRMDTPSTAPPTSAREIASDALKHRYESHLNRARDERIKRYVDQANESMKSKNLVAAMNSLRIALSLSPEDPELASRFAAVEKQASAGLAEQYVEQARYEERRGEFAAAAAAYERATRGRPSAQLHERVAHCLLEARGDPKAASDHARKAVEMAPNETAYRITLARVYGRAGMEQSALGELERARTLDPSDDTIKDWIKRVKRGEI